MFDGVTDTFSDIALPEGAGLPFNNYLTQDLPRGRPLALATGGDARSIRRGTAPPFPGNEGLLLVDLAEGTAIHLDLPEGFHRAIPGNFRQAQESGRMFGMIPLLGRAYGVFRRPNNPGGSAIVTWDMETGTATELPLPGTGYAVVQALGTGRAAAQAPLVWAFSARTASFAFGVYDEVGSLISVGSVGP